MTNEEAREKLQERYGDVWNTSELQQTFTVHGFRAPYVSVTRKADGKRGSLMFDHDPRFYYGFMVEG